MAFAAETPVPSKADERADVKSLTLKLMVVNPSDKFKQTFPVKAFLPEEVQPEHILDKEDLELGYDAAKRAYYAAKEIELDPGQSVVKAIRIEDIWIIADRQMNDLADEARELFKKLHGSKYEPRGRLLLDNVEVLLTQIYERQNDDTVAPDEHISIYRDNKQKIRDIEMDIVSLRRFAAGAGSEGLFGKSDGGAASLGLPFASSTWDKELADAAKGGGIPAWMAWRIIFGILFFLGFLTAGFYFVWFRQVSAARKRANRTPEEESLNLDELFGPPQKKTEDSPAAPKLDAEEMIPPPNDEAA